MTTSTADRDQLYSVLSHPFRRHVVQILHEKDDETLSWQGLVVALRDRLTDRSVESTDEVDDHVSIALHHNHLPKLDAANVVSYDPGSQRVTAGPQLPAAVQPLGTGGNRV